MEVPSVIGKSIHIPVQSDSLLTSVVPSSQRDDHGEHVLSQSRNLTMSLDYESENSMDSMLVRSPERKCFRFADSVAERLVDLHPTVPSVDGRLVRSIQSVCSTLLVVLSQWM